MYPSKAVYIGETSHKEHPKSPEVNAVPFRQDGLVAYLGIMQANGDVRRAHSDKSEHIRLKK